MLRVGAKNLKKQGLDTSGGGPKPGFAQAGATPSISLGLWRWHLP